MPKYKGPFNPLVVEGKAYSPGDDVPVSQEVVDILVKNGHRFEDTQTGEDMRAPSRDVNDPVLVKRVIDAGKEPTGLVADDPVVEQDQKTTRTKQGRSRKKAAAKTGAADADGASDNGGDTTPPE